LRVLLVDFGASRVKSAFWSEDARRITASLEIAAPVARVGNAGEVECDPEAYWHALERTAGQLLRTQGSADALWICSEMHGMLIGSPDSGLPLTPYIGWRDERTRRSACDAISAIDRIAPHGEAVFAATGMRLRTGLPLLTLAHLRRAEAFSSGARLFTLIDWLLWRGGERDPAIHASLAAGTGLFDISAGDWSPEMLRLAGVYPDELRLPRIARMGASIGRIRVCGHEVDVFGGIGDLQAAAHGAGFPERAPLLVNLGTGSQVLADAKMFPAAVESRVGARGDRFGALTHIPAGRALDVFAGLLDGCADAAGGRAFFWKAFAQLAASDVLTAKEDIDLNVFEAAWRYRGGGSIGGIVEGRWSVATFLAALARSWLAQYAEAMSILDPQRRLQNFIVAGGLSRRASFVLPVLERLCERRGVVAVTSTGEETLDGLLSLALRRPATA
jgi:sugar (pentulose or hexulose) kinase